MAASKLRNVRCPKAFVFRTMGLNFRGPERRMNTTAWRLLRSVNGGQVQTEADGGKDGEKRDRNDELPRPQSMTKSSKTTRPEEQGEDFFGFLGGEGVTEVAPNPEGPIDVITKYSSVVSKQWEADMEKVYVTNFGNIRLDKDNPVKFHGQLDPVALTRRRQSDEMEGDDGFRDPQMRLPKQVMSNISDVDFRKGRSNLREVGVDLPNGNKYQRAKGRSTLRQVEQPDSKKVQPDLKNYVSEECRGPTTRDNASSYLDEQYFGESVKREKLSEIHTPDTTKSTVDNKINKNEIVNTLGKPAVSPDVSDTSYSSYVLTRFNDATAQNEAEIQDSVSKDNVENKGASNYLENNFFNHQEFSGSSDTKANWSPLKPKSRPNESSRVSPADLDELVSTKVMSTTAAAESEESLEHEHSLDKNYPSYVLNILPNKTKIEEQRNGEANAVTKSNFLEESIIEFSETSKNERQKTDTEPGDAEMLKMLSEPPPFFSRLETDLQTMTFGDNGDAFGNSVNVVENGENIKKRKQASRKNKNASHGFKSENAETMPTKSAGFEARVNMLAGVDQEEAFDNYGSYDMVESNDDASALQDSQKVLRSKSENTKFGTHPELKTRDKSLKTLAYKQSRSTTSPQQPPPEPVLEEGAEYVKPEDMELPSRENIGHRVVLPEPRFDKKLKFPPKEGSEESIFADEFVSEFLHEEAENMQDGKEEPDVDENASVPIAKLVAKTQNLEEQPEFVVLQLLKDSVMYNDHGVLVLYKPFGLPIHASKGYRHNLSKFLPDLAKFVDHENPSPELFTVHRLDRGTTGVLVLAKTQEMAKTLNTLFKARKVHKTYWAITKGIPNPLQGIIKIPIAEGTIVGRRRMVLKPDYTEDAKLVVKKSSVSVREAITPYRVLTATGNAALVEATPETGVTHQLRVHFGFGLGCPVLGDHKYTHLTKLAPQRLPADMLKRLNVAQTKVRDLPIHLHSRSVVIPEILDGRNIYVQAGLPKHMQWAVRKLKLRRRSNPLSNKV